MNNINKKVQEALDSLDTIQKAEAPLFFETRLKARIEKELLQAITPWYYIKRPALIVACLLFFMCINMLVLLQPKSSNEETVIEKMSIESFASDYGLADN